MSDEVPATAAKKKRGCGFWLLVSIPALLVLGLLVQMAAPEPGAELKDGVVALREAFIGEPESMGGIGNYSALAEEGATPAMMRLAAAEFCRGGKICQVMAWRDADQRAKVMPMLDREVAAMAFSYTVNRNSGYEKALWDCTVWPGKPDECLSK